MSNSLRKVDYYYVMVSNTAGQGAKVLAALAKEGVNLVAFSGFPSGGKGQLDLVPDKSAKFRRAAKKLKLKLSKRKTGFLLQGDDRVGAMTTVLGKLAKARINVTAMDAVTAGKGREMPWARMICSTALRWWARITSPALSRDARASGVNIVSAARPTNFLCGRSPFRLVQMKENRSSSMESPAVRRLRYSSCAFANSSEMRAAATLSFVSK